MGATTGEWWDSCRQLLNLIYKNGLLFEPLTRPAEIQIFGHSVRQVLHLLAETDYYFRVYDKFDRFWCASPPSVVIQLLAMPASEARFLSTSFATGLWKCY